MFLRQRPRGRVSGAAMISRLLLVYSIVRKRFGFYFRPLFVFVLLAMYRIFIGLCLLLDPIFFPALAKKEVKAPIFIVGNPRSGTTFLHRWMVDHQMGAGFQLWEMLFPSLTARVLVRPFLKPLEALSPARFHKNKAHETSLTSVETDDVAVLFRFLDGPFLYGYFLAWDDVDHANAFDPEGEYGRTAQRDLDWLRELFRRNMVWHGRDRVVAKLFSAALRPAQLLNAFPDGKILYMVRDPVSTIPSGMSLVCGVLEGALHMSRLPLDVQRRYQQRLSFALEELYRRFHTAWTTGKLDKDRVYMVRYDRLMSEFDVVMREIVDFLGDQPDAAFWAEVKKTAESQRGRKSEHVYALETYGLNKEKIQQDLGFVYDAYGVPKS